MNENNESYLVNQQPTPDPERLREKLLLAVNQVSQKLPELIESVKKPDMQMRMMMNAFRPFLPKLEDSLEKALIEAPPENILKLVEYVEALNEWLHND